MNNLTPRYKCEAIAREVSRLLRLSPALPWQAVREFAEPRLPGMQPPRLMIYPDELRPLVAKRLMVELRHQHVWSR